MAPSPSGKARVCKTLITSSNLVGASIIIFANHILMDIKTRIYFLSILIKYAGVAKWQTRVTIGELCKIARCTRNGSINLIVPYPTVNEFL